MNCSICEDKISGWGNNAAPVNDGTCCDKCNWTVVIPTRLGMIQDTQKCQHNNTYVAVRHVSGVKLVKCKDCGKPLD